MPIQIIWLIKSNQALRGLIATLKLVLNISVPGEKFDDPHLRLAARIIAKRGHINHNVLLSSPSKNRIHPIQQAHLHSFYLYHIPIYRLECSTLHLYRLPANKWKAFPSEAAHFRFVFQRQRREPRVRLVHGLEGCCHDTLCIYAWHAHEGKANGKSRRRFRVAEAKRARSMNSAREGWN